jgi:L-lactate dehydrogenase complex protein LldF
MRIPLPKMMRHWREREFERHLQPARIRFALKAWAFLARRPMLYRLAARLAATLLAKVAGARGSFQSLPLASGWTATRDMPAPEGETFQALWRARSR